MAGSKTPGANYSGQVEGSMASALKLIKVRPPRPVKVADATRPPSASSGLIRRTASWLFPLQSNRKAGIPGGIAVRNSRSQFSSCARGRAARFRRRPCAAGYDPALNALAAKGVRIVILALRVEGPLRRLLEAPCGLSAGTSTTESAVETTRNSSATTKSR
jgi:hypothetical protein